MWLWNTSDLFQGENWVIICRIHIKITRMKQSCCLCYSLLTVPFLKDKATIPQIRQCILRVNFVLTPDSLFPYSSGYMVKQVSETYLEIKDWEALLKVSGIWWAWAIHCLASFRTFTCWPLIQHFWISFFFFLKIFTNIQTWIVGLENWYFISFLRNRILF